MNEQCLPAPLLPPEVDLRDFRFMPLDVVRLRDSGLVSDFEPEEIVAAILLWSASWHQLPASSLPDSDKQLAKLAGYGRGVREFLKVKTGALHRFAKCSDGRWYHHVVAEKAAEGWNAKIKEEWKRACDRARKSNKERAERKESALPMPLQPPLLSVRLVNGIPCWRYWDSGGGGADSGGTPDDDSRKSRLKGSEGTEKGQGQGLGKNAAAPRAGPEADDPVFGPYIAMMQRKGVSSGHARSFFGLMRKTHGDKAVLEVLAKAEGEDISAPVAWIKAALEARAKPRLNHQEALEARNQESLKDWQPPEVRDATR